ncbi:hypothetical protein AKJ16_DCAP09623 [Drosera capensis]
MSSSFFPLGLSVSCLFSLCDIPCRYHGARSDQRGFHSGRYIWWWKKMLRYVEKVGFEMEDDVNQHPSFLWHEDKVEEVC